MKAAFFDVDGTLTKHRVWSGVLDYFRENKVRLMRFYMFTWFHFFMYLFHKAGLVSQVKFRGAWAKNLSWHFAGFTLDQASEVWDWVIEYRIHDQWRANIVDVLHQHKDQGVVIFLVSGAPEGLLERISREVGGDYVVGTKHQVLNGVYTGRSEGVACQGEFKALLVKEKIQAVRKSGHCIKCLGKKHDNSHACREKDIFCRFCGLKNHASFLCLQREKEKTSSKGQLLVFQDADSEDNYGSDSEREEREERSSDNG